MTRPGTWLLLASLALAACNGLPQSQMGLDAVRTSHAPVVSLRWEAERSLQLAPLRAWESVEGSLLRDGQLLGVAPGQSQASGLRFAFPGGVVDGPVRLRLVFQPVHSASGGLPAPTEVTTPPFVLVDGKGDASLPAQLGLPVEAPAPEPGSALVNQVLGYGSKPKPGARVALVANAMPLPGGHSWIYLGSSYAWDSRLTTTALTNPESAQDQVFLVKQDAAGSWVSLPVLGGLGRGFRDGGANEAQFNGLHDALVLDANRVLLVDTYNHALRLMARETEGAWRLSTVVGKGGAGYADGMASAARLNRPVALEAGLDGTIYVADAGNRRVRTLRQSPDGWRLGTLSGDGQNRRQDGVGVAASHQGILDMVWWQGRLLLSEKVENPFNDSPSGQGALRWLSPEGRCETALVENSSTGGLPLFQLVAKPGGQGIWALSHRAILELQQSNGVVSKQRVAGGGTARVGPWGGVMVGESGGGGNICLGLDAANQLLIFSGDLRRVDVETQEVVSVAQASVSGATTSAYGGAGYLRPEVGSDALRSPWKGLARFKDGCFLVSRQAGCHILSPGSESFVAVPSGAFYSAHCTDQRDGFLGIDGMTLTYVKDHHRPDERRNIRPGENVGAPFRVSGLLRDLTGGLGGGSGQAFDPVTRRLVRGQAGRIVAVDVDEDPAASYEYLAGVTETYATQPDPQADGMATQSGVSPNVFSLDVDDRGRVWFVGAESPTVRRVQRLPGSGWTTTTLFRGGLVQGREFLPQQICTFPGDRALVLSRADANGARMLVAMDPDGQGGYSLREVLPFGGPVGLEGFARQFPGGGLSYIGRGLDLNLYGQRHVSSTQLLQVSNW